MVRYIGFATLAFLSGVLPSRAQSNRDDLLQRAVARVRDTTERLSKLVCTQTVDRADYTVEPQPPHGCDWWRRALEDRILPGSPVQWDRVRADVLDTSEGELYSWPGADRFNDRDLLRLVRIRPLSTGGFSGFLTSIFAPETDIASLGEIVADGRKLREYSFRVPRERSRYWIGTGSSRRVVACEGTFAIDPETAELVRLVVKSGEPPEAGGVCLATTTLDYHGSFGEDPATLLPATSVFDFATKDGKEGRNSTSWSNCHQFGAESTLRFDEPPGGAQYYAVIGQPPAARLPDGLPFRIVLTREIAFNKLAAGDTVEAKLDTPIQDRSKKVLVPAGAPVVVRVLDADMARARRPGGQVLLAHLILRLEFLTVSGRAQPFVATSAQRVETSDPLARSVDFNVNRNVIGNIRNPDTAGLILAPNTVLLEFFNIGRNFVLKPGLRTKWTTGGTGPSAACVAGLGPCR